MPNQYVNMCHYKHLLPEFKTQQGIYVSFWLATFFLCPELIYDFSESQYTQKLKSCTHSYFQNIAFFKLTCILWENTVKPKIHHAKSALC